MPGDLFRLGLPHLSARKPGDAHRWRNPNDGGGGVLSSWVFIGFAAFGGLSKLETGAFPSKFTATWMSSMVKYWGQGTR